ncbi:8-oxo-dGTP diphosphatase MutT [Catenovulum sp. SM1970]|uniref:8-oxo-dGTP diphosphatase MutT n=1 Tax=Marinifaba aquimaris TaxID=2741323 RepID=UPI0015737420|nr:8-oxo-dGTP diphosphatase MutT [Marinifaba aquimaris]NTS76577.1 8-oxo-dGTP diphosphatase MutT [Marinifaba aquimaris]
MKKQVHVAVGVVIDQDQRVLLAKRHQEQHQGGLWEFPGGKVEEGESCLQALQREFLEEVNIGINTAQSLITVEHDYGDKAVKLETLVSYDFSGDAKGLEGQKVEWVKIAELHNYQFPEANKVILQAIEQL